MPIADKGVIEEPALAKLLKEKFSFSDTDIDEFVRGRINFKNRVLDLISEVNQGKTQTQFEDLSRYIIAPSDQKRWIREIIRCIQNGGDDLFESVYLGALSNYIYNFDPSQLYKDSKSLFTAVNEIFQEEFSRYFKGTDINADMEKIRNKVNFPGSFVERKPHEIPALREIQSRIRHSY